MSKKSATPKMTDAQFIVHAAINMYGGSMPTKADIKAVADLLVVAKQEIRRAAADGNV